MSPPRGARRDRQPPAAGGAPPEPAPPRAQAALRLRYRIEVQTERVTRLAWSPDGRTLAVPSRDGKLRLHDAATGTLQQTVDAHIAEVLGVCWSPDGKAVASIDGDTLVMTRVGRPGAPPQRIAPAERSLTAVAWSPCGRMVTATSESGAVLGMDAVVRDGGLTLVKRASLPSPGAVSMAWAADGRRVVVGARDGAVRVWDPWTGTLLGTLTGHRDAAVTCAWAPDGSLFATGAKDRTIWLWDAETRRPLRVLDTHRDHVIAIAFRADGSLFASKSRDGTVLVWRADGRLRPVAVIPEPTAEIGWSVGLAFNPREPWLATLGLGDRIVRVWELDLARLPTSELEPGAIAAFARWRPEPRVPGEVRRVLLV